LFSKLKLLFIKTISNISGLGGTSEGYKSISNTPTRANIDVSNTATYASLIFYQTAV